MTLETVVACSTRTLLRIACLQLVRNPTIFDKSVRLSGADWPDPRHGQRGRLMDSAGDGSSRITHTCRGFTCTPWSGRTGRFASGAISCQTCVKRTVQISPVSDRIPHDGKHGNRTAIEPPELGRTRAHSVPGLITRRSQVQILPPLRRKPLAFLHVPRVFSRPESQETLMSNLCQTLAPARMWACP